MEQLLLLVICFAIVCWAMQAPRYMLSCPFQVVATTVVFILPQLYILYRHPTLAPADGISSFTWHSILCVCMTFAGYTFKKNEQTDGKRIALDERWLRTLAICTGLVGFISLLGLGYYLNTYGVPRFWRGWPVYLYFLSKLLIPALALSRLMQAVYRKRVYLLLSLLWSIPILVMSVQIGRRSWSIMLVFFWLFPFIVTKQIQIRPWLVLAGCVFAFGVVVLLPAYRGDIHERGLAALPSILKEKPVQRVLDHYFSGEQTLEIRDTCVLFAAANQIGEFSLGARQYNGFIHNYFPGSLLGQDNKESLKLPLPDYQEAIIGSQLRNTTRGGDVKFNTSKTGFFDSFAEYWYFGSLAYFLLGFYFRRLEDSCFDARDPRAMLVLCFIGLLPALVVYTQWSTAWTMHLPAMLLCILAIRYGSKRVAVTPRPVFLQENFSRIRKPA